MCCSEKCCKCSDTDVVLKVLVHCEGCANDIFRCLIGYHGAQEVCVDIENNKVTVRGRNPDAMKILARLRRKFSRNAQLISPIPESPPEVSPETEKQEIKIITVKLKILMHCQGCVRDIEKCIYGMGGVLTVEVDMQNDTMIVTGAIDPSRLMERIRKNLGKHVEIIELKQEVEKVEEKATDSPPEEVTVYECTPQYIDIHKCPCEMFSDENSESCSLM